MSRIASVMGDEGGDPYVQGIGTGHERKEERESNGRKRTISSGIFGFFCGLD